MAMSDVPQPLATLLPTELATASENKKQFVQVAPRKTDLPQDVVVAHRLPLFAGLQPDLVVPIIGKPQIRGFRAADQMAQFTKLQPVRDLTNVAGHIFGGKRTSTGTAPVPLSARTIGEKKLDEDLSNRSPRLKPCAIRPVVHRYTRGKHTGKIRAALLHTGLRLRPSKLHLSEKGQIGAGLELEGLVLQQRAQPLGELQTRCDVGEGVSLLDVDLTKFLPQVEVGSTAPNSAAASASGASGAEDENGGEEENNGGLVQPYNYPAVLDLVGLSSIGLSKEKKRKFTAMEPVPLSEVPEVILG